MTMMQVQIQSPRKMTVKPIYGFTVDGVEVRLEFVRPGGIEAIKVSTEQYRDRLFALKDYPGEEQHPSMRGTNPTWLAQDICTFVFTGHHPTDRGWNGPTMWGSGLSRDYAEQMIARMIEEAWDANAR